MNKAAVVYYSWSGRTGKMARIIADNTGADLIELKPNPPYTKNYSDLTAQAKSDIAAGILPQLETELFDLSGYDAVYVGSPIWWGTIAPPVAVFLQKNNLNGKSVFPFTTHGGGGKGSSEGDIAKLCESADIKAMYTAYEGGKQEDLIAWANKI